MRKLTFFCIGDSLFHAVSLCSVTARKIETISFLTCINSNDNNIIGDLLFTSVTDIVSTKLLVGAVDNSDEHLPFIDKDMLMHDSGNNCKYSAKSVSEISYLYFIELNPNNDVLLPCRNDFRLKWSQLHVTSFLDENEKNSYEDTEYESDEDKIITNNEDII